MDETDVVGDYQRALAAGDAEATVATFEPDGYVREPAGGEYVHRGHDELRSLYELFFSNGGGIPLEHCSSTDDGRACALLERWIAQGSGSVGYRWRRSASGSYLTPLTFRFRCR